MLRGGQVAAATVGQLQERRDQLAFQRNGLEQRRARCADDALTNPAARVQLQQLIEQIAAGTLPVQVGRTFQIDEIVEAHRCMEENKAGGKIVVLT